MNIKEKVYRMNSDIGSYPTKIVIAHDLKRRTIKIVGNQVIKETEKWEKDALKIILTINGKCYDKKNIKEQIERVLKKMIKEFS